MEHIWTYIFQELKLVSSEGKDYSSEEAARLTRSANMEIFLPKAQDLGGEIVKQQSSRNLICFDQLKNAEEYISQMGSLLEEFKKQKSHFYFENTAYIWTQKVRKLNEEKMLTLKDVSILLKAKKGNYCSQKLHLESHRFGKVIVETDNFYLCELIPNKLKTTVKKTKIPSLRILVIILIAVICFIISRQLLSKLNTKLDAKRYSKIRLSLDSNEPQLTFQILKNTNVKDNDSALDEIIFKYIEQEWKIFVDLPKGSSPKILRDRIELLTDVFPWSNNLKFFSRLLNLSIEFDQRKIPMKRIKSILHNSSSANKNKVIILISFCLLYELDPFFLSSDLKKLNLKNHNKLYLNFFEACLKSDIKGKELEFLKWFKVLPSLEIEKHLKQWIKYSVTPLDKNSFIILIMMQQMDPILAQNYIQKKLSEKLSPVEEIEMLILIKDASSREILAAYLEELMQNTNRGRLDPEVQSVVKTVLSRLTS